MLLLEIVKSYHKMHAKQNNICGNQPEYATKIEGFDYFGRLFVAVLHTIQNPSTRKKIRKMSPNRQILFIYYFLVIFCFLFLFLFIYT